MDHHWVSTSWLSDVGLPQYCQTFQTHLVDGRVLNSLSRRDLEKFLNIGDHFHQTSLLLAIQLLQMLSFDKEVKTFIESDNSCYPSSIICHKLTCKQLQAFQTASRVNYYGTIHKENTEKKSLHCRAAR